MELESALTIENMGIKIQHLNLKDITPVNWIELEGKIHYLGEFRDLSSSKVLNKFLPDTSVLSINIGYLQPNNVMPLHENLYPHILIFFSGDGKIMGDYNQVIKSGDTVFVPAGQKHSFIAGPKGMYSVCIQLSENIINKGKPFIPIASSAHSNLIKLLTDNEKYLKKFYSHDLFKIIQSGYLEDKHKNEVFINCVQFWLQKCDEPLLSHKNITEKSYDNIIEIIADWFIYQALVLDQAEKWAINYLVLRNVNNLFLCLHKSSNPAENIAYKNDLIKINELGEHLQANYDDVTCNRIQQIISQAWGMIDELISRIYFLMNV